MSTATEIMAALAAPFDPDAVSWRPGSMTKDKTKAKALAYIDARDVMRRLDDVCGPWWQVDYLPMPNSTTCCRIGLIVDGQWVWRANGAGDTDIEAQKGGYSDAFKRAAVLWGIGRYLYDLDAPWVRLTEWKQIDPAEMPKLRALLGTKPLARDPARKEPVNEATKAKFRDDWKALAEGLLQCETVEQIDDYLTRHAEMIQRMPAGWKSNWVERVENTRRIVAQLQAAA